DLSEAGDADHVVLLAGRVVADGPPEAVLTDDNLAAAYGPGLLHADHGVPMIDDPAHVTRQAHQHREWPG
ncbi:MAG: metal ABC transporter ATP-binding protein, partial [Acidimicrobiia bacterium]